MGSSPIEVAIARTRMPSIPERMNVSAKRKIAVRRRKRL